MWRAKVPHSLQNISLAFLFILGSAACGQFTPPEVIPAESAAPSPPAKTWTPTVDPKVQWSEAGNIRYNAAMRTGMYYALSPVRWVGNLFKSR